MAHDPVSAETTVESVAGIESPGFLGPYVDRALTRRNLPFRVIPKIPTPSGSTTLGNVRAFYCTDRLQEIEAGRDLPARDPLPHSSNSWILGRDYYRNNGMVGQDFFKNPDGIIS